MVSSLEGKRQIQNAPMKWEKRILSIHCNWYPTGCFELHVASEPWKGKSREWVSLDATRYLISTDIHAIV